MILDSGRLTVSVSHHADYIGKQRERERQVGGWAHALVGEQKSELFSAEQRWGQSQSRQQETVDRHVI